MKIWNLRFSPKSMFKVQILKEKKGNDYSEIPSLGVMQ